VLALAFACFCVACLFVAFGDLSPILWWSIVSEVANYQRERATVFYSPLSGSTCFAVSRLGPMEASCALVLVTTPASWSPHDSRITSLRLTMSQPRCHRKPRSAPCVQLRNRELEALFTVFSDPVSADGVASC
jgi:hypothetical protein